MLWDPQQLQHTLPMACLTQMMDKEEIKPCSTLRGKKLESQEAPNHLCSTDLCSGPAGSTAATTPYSSLPVTKQDTLMMVAVVC